jgi:hypothetical protein
LVSNEEKQVEMYIVDYELNILVANLTTFTLTRLINLASSLDKLRPADKIVRVMHVNASTRKMFIALADSSLIVVVDLTRATLEWKLPSMQGCGIPLAITSDADKAIVAYDSNKLVIFDTINMKLHDWTKSNLDKMPQNFLNRYNRIIGLTMLTDSKVIAFSNYTYAILDLDAPVPREVEIVQNHPGKTIEGRQTNAQGWFDNLKLSQQKYLTTQQQVTTEPTEQQTSSKNLSISNRYKGILAMEWDKDAARVTIVENTWQKAVS